MYADRMSSAMEEAIAETDRRREVQTEYNKKHGITPATIKKEIANILERHNVEAVEAASTSIEAIKNAYSTVTSDGRKKLLAALRAEMFNYAKNLEFESAAAIRDEINKLEG
jgi:excinuclease ABC subunit B